MITKLSIRSFMYKIFTDTDCDITPQIAKRYGFGLISMPYIENEKEIYPYVDWEEFDHHRFYDALRSGKLATTCGLSPEQYRAYFEPVFKSGQDILYAHFSACMSGTFSAMKIAVDDLLKEYPERRFYEIDTKGITIGAANIILEIGDLYLEGKSPEEIMRWAEKEVDKFAIYFYADDLKFFAKSGRVSGISAKMGNFFGIHPIIYMDREGKMVSFAKVRGRSRALQTILSYVDTIGDDIEKHRIIVAHTDALPLAEKIESLLKEKYGDDLNIIFMVVNPTAGAHCGPDCIGVSFHAKHR